MNGIERQVIVAIELKTTEKFGEVNRITGVYGRQNFEQFIDRQFETGKLLAVNKEKTDNMLHSIGKKYPKENSYISYDDTITYSIENVKYPDGNLNLQYLQAKVRPYRKKERNRISYRLMYG